MARKAEKSKRRYRREPMYPRQCQPAKEEERRREGYSCEEAPEELALGHFLSALAMQPEIEVMLQRPEEDADDEADNKGEEDELNAGLVEAVFFINNRYGFDSQIDDPVIKTIIAVGGSSAS